MSSTSPPRRPSTLSPTWSTTSSLTSSARLITRHATSVIDAPWWSYAATRTPILNRERTASDAPTTPCDPLQPGSSRTAVPAGAPPLVGRWSLQRRRPRVRSGGSASSADAR
eukprot:1056571-Prorocentrum_minimum.AAC.1